MDPIKEENELTEVALDYINDHEEKKNQSGPSSALNFAKGDSGLNSIQSNTNSKLNNNGSIEEEKVQNNSSLIKLNSTLATDQDLRGSIYPTL
jgi:hypothetical protein